MFFFSIYVSISFINTLTHTLHYSMLEPNLWRDKFSRWQQGPQLCSMYVYSEYTTRYSSSPSICSHFRQLSTISHSHPSYRHIFHSSLTLLPPVARRSFFRSVLPDKCNCFYDKRGYHQQNRTDSSSSSSTGEGDKSLFSISLSFSSLFLFFSFLPVSKGHELGTDEHLFKTQKFEF